MQAGSIDGMRIIRQHACIKVIGRSSIYKGVGGQNCGAMVITDRSNTENSVKSM